MGRRRVGRVILLLVSFLRTSVELPRLSFAQSLVGLWLECQTFMFIVFYPLLDLIWWDHDYVFKTWDIVWRFYYSYFWELLHVDEILCMMIFRCEFYEKSIYVCFKKNGDVTSKLFWYMNYMHVLLLSGFRVLTCLKWNNLLVGRIWLAS